MTRRRLLLALTLAPALAACGRKGDLKPPPKKDEDKRKPERRTGS